MAHRIHLSARKALLAAATILSLATAACGSDKGGSTGPSDPPPPPPPTGPALLRVSNQTSDAIEAVKVRLCGMGSFGANLIGSDKIEPGESQTMQVPVGCRDVGVWSAPAVGKDAYKSGVIFIEGVTKQLNLPVWP